MKTNQVKQTNLESILQEFHVESEGRPNPTVLEAYCREYPQYASELTDYALEWLLDKATNAVNTSEAVVNASSPYVSRAISRLYDHIRDREAAVEKGGRSSVIRTLNPFEALSVARVRAIRDALGIDTPLFAKFRNRLIDPGTVPGGFLGRFADALELRVEEFLSYLQLPPMVHTASDFKADGKPAVTANKEHFEDAVRNSFLDEEKKQALLKG